MSVPHWVGHRAVTFGFAWVEAVEIQGASVLSVLALEEDKALKEPEQD
jgi:hypothetical protein